MKLQTKALSLQRNSSGNIFETWKDLTTQAAFKFCFTLLVSKLVFVYHHLYILFWSPVSAIKAFTVAPYLSNIFNSTIGSRIFFRHCQALWCN